MGKRLDVRLLELGLCRSREHGQALILAGEVWTAERRLDKPGMSVADDLPIEVRSQSLDYVSRAGYKMAHALLQFGISVQGKTALDIGASTGGFTHCLLKNGAEKVVAVDVGYGQIDVNLRNDPRVVVMERVNARYLKSGDIAEAATLEIVVVDVSFISLKPIIQNVAIQFPSLKTWILLFKPQFEVGPKFVGKKGLVQDQNAIQEALQAFQKFMGDLSFTLRNGPVASPVAGKKSGNIEYLIHYEK